MKEKIKIALWNRVKSTYPIGTSKHTNALLEEDFDSFIEDVVKICTIPTVVGRSEQLVCNCQGCGEVKKIEYCEKCYAENLPDIAN
jgi:hypothetical protein